MRVTVDEAVLLLELLLLSVDERVSEREDIVSDECDNLDECLELLL